AGLVDWWFGGQHVRHLVVRAWFRHFGSTSWLAEDASGAPVGFLVGYRSHDRSTEAILHLVGVHPNHRRRGIGRALVRSFLADVASAGATTATAVAWPGEPIATAFFRALDFRPDDGPDSQNLFGTPAFPDYEGDGEDRILFVRWLAPGGPDTISSTSP
ncbi:MAG TPA: GNAT family N-acetyltransferase, partial [Candidatus Limnocylindrales bacterium]|nr:GNAT family N-acetyltransferase [Candidatus Limnocylindrales bacterium]